VGWKFASSFPRLQRKRQILPFLAEVGERDAVIHVSWVVQIFIYNCINQQ
jgi:hypothetical protein